MEDKTFALVTQLYSEMTTQFAEINHKLDQKADKSDIIRLENGIAHLANDVARLENGFVRLENDFGTKTDALLDGFQKLSEGQETIKGLIQELQEKITNQDIQITVLMKAT